MLYANSDDRLVANDCAADVATTAGVILVMPSMTPTCSSELRQRIAQMTRPKEQKEREEQMHEYEYEWGMCRYCTSVGDMESGITVEMRCSTANNGCLTST